MQTKALPGDDRVRQRLAVNVKSKHENRQISAGPTHVAHPCFIVSDVPPSRNLLVAPPMNHANLPIALHER